MKLIDIYERGIKLPLDEMATNRNKARQNVLNLSETLAYHITKIFMMSDSQHVNHWLKEINNYLNNLKNIKLKTKTKRITYEQYKELLTKPVEGNISWIISQARKEYPNENIKLPNVLRRDVYNVIEKMCVDLAIGQVKNAREYFK